MLSGYDRECTVHGHTHLTACTPSMKFSLNRGKEGGGVCVCVCVALCAISITSLWKTSSSCDVMTGGGRRIGRKGDRRTVDKPCQPSDLFWQLFIYSKMKLLYQTILSDVYSINVIGFQTGFMRRVRPHDDCRIFSLLFSVFADVLCFADLELSWSHGDWNPIFLRRIMGSNDFLKSLFLTIHSCLLIFSNGIFWFT